MEETHVGEFAIFRSRDQGVVFGRLVSLVVAPGGLGVAIIEEARQIHGWDQSIHTLFEAANRGFGLARISEPLVKRLTMFGICGVLPCTQEAIDNLRQSRWNALPQSSE